MSSRVGASSRQTILDEIVARNLIDLQEARARIDRRARDEQALALPPCRPFEAALRGAPGTALIAEVKRASPARGTLNETVDPAHQAELYAGNGAAAISVLTERHYFGAMPGDPRRVREAVSLPVLRKDFLFDPWQIGEARAMGADAALLIAALLDADALNEMLAEMDRFGLGHLVEAYDERDLERILATPARVIGINNRNLRTFEVSLENTRRLAAAIRRERPDAVIVSESGVFTADDVRRARDWGADAVLVGEALMKADDVAARTRQLSAVGLREAR